MRTEPVPVGVGRRSAAWPFPLFRAVVAVQTLLVFAQAVFAGQFLSGDGAALGLHELSGTEIITVVALAQIVTAVFVWRPGHGPVLPAVLSVVLFLAVGLQIGMGFAGQLSVHVPLGVAILAVLVALLVGAPRRSS